MKLSELVNIAEQDKELLESRDLNQVYEIYVNKLTDVEKIAENLNDQSQYILGSVLQDIFNAEKNFQTKSSFTEWIVKDSNIAIAILIEEKPTLIKPYSTLAIKVSRGSKNSIFRLIIKHKEYDFFPFIHEYKRHLSNFHQIKDIHDFKLVDTRMKKISSIKSILSHNYKEEISGYLFSFNGMGIDSSEIGVRSLLEQLLGKAECLKS